MLPHKFWKNEDCLAFVFAFWSSCSNAVKFPELPLISVFLFWNLYQNRKLYSFSWDASGLICALRHIYFINLDNEVSVCKKEVFHVSSHVSTCRWEFNCVYIYICIAYIHIYLFIQFLEYKQLGFFFLINWRIASCSQYTTSVPSSASAEQGEMIMSW